MEIAFPDIPLDLIHTGVNFKYWSIFFYLWLCVNDNRSVLLEALKVFVCFRYPYIFGSLFCFLRGLLAETSGNATVLTITGFTVERYLAICHPFLSHTMSKLSRAVKFILLIWFVSTSFNGNWCICMIV